jgi:hypothetical protein
MVNVIIGRIFGLKTNWIKKVENVDSLDNATHN